ncbi:MAG: hypothetical protein QXU78_04050, partial [Sulfolobales archaeon]
MAKLSKLILVTADHHPLHKYFKELAEELSKKYGVPLDIRVEDYLFLIEHGDTDEYGMAWLPQLLAELDSGEIVKVLTKPVLDSMGNLSKVSSIVADLGQAIYNVSYRIAQAESQVNKLAAENVVQRLEKVEGRVEELSTHYSR